MVIKGNGGEGKSQIGAVLGTLFGSNMKDDIIRKISENRFARADFEHILLCVDDDMRMEALRQTNNETTTISLIFWIQMGIFAGKPIYLPAPRSCMRHTRFTALKITCPPLNPVASAKP